MTTAAAAATRSVTVTAVSPSAADHSVNCLSTCLSTCLSVLSERAGSVSVSRVVSSDEPGVPAGGAGDTGPAGDTTDPEPETTGQC